MNLAAPLLFVDLRRRYNAAVPDAIKIVVEAWLP
jgi:hypothetical protein